MKFVLNLILIVFAQFCLAQQEGSGLVYKTRTSSIKTGTVPVLFILHGYGSNEDDLFELSASIDPRYMIYCLRAPLSIGNGGFAWYHLSRDKDKKLLYDYQEAAKSRIKVMQFIREQCRLNKLDSNQVVLMGFSQGAMLAYDLALSYPGKIRSVLALSGRLLEESKSQSKSTFIQSTSFFIAHGLNDEMIPVSEAEKAKAHLLLIKVRELEYKTYPMQHTINGQEIIDIRAWLRKLLETNTSVKGKASSTKK